MSDCKKINRECEDMKCEECLQNYCICGSDTAKWKKVKEESKKKRWSNYQKSIEMLSKKGISYRVLDHLTGHIRVGKYDFWPTTGKFYDPKTKETGRGVKNLIEKLNE